MQFQKSWVGLKNIYDFATALSAKNVWRLITGKGLWCQVIVQKYIAPASVEEWIRLESKSFYSGSIIWNATIKANPLIGRWLV